MSDDIEIDRTTESFSRGVVTKLKCKRGTEPRDQDEAVTKIKGRNMEDVEKMGEGAEEFMEEKLEAMREIQPEREEDDE